MGGGISRRIRSAAKDGIEGGKSWASPNPVMQLPSAYSGNVKEPSPVMGVCTLHRPFLKCL